MVRTCEFLSWKLFLASFTNDKKLSTIYEAEKSYELFSSMGLTFIPCPQIKEMVSFSIPFSTTGKKFMLRLIPVWKFWRAAENHSQSDKSRSSASILVLFPSLIPPGISTFLFVCSRSTFQV